MKIRQLNKNIVIKLLMLPILVCCLTGCIYLIVGGLGAVGGYVVSPDTVEGLTENDSLTVWEAAYEIVSIMGTIQAEQEDAGILNANISGALVTISIVPINQTTTKLTVKARKNYLPKISTAQDVFVKIMDRLGV